ncbi:UNVERIFIED_ORG: putative membrane protein [Agrobacterium larrymoorei]|nr:putative membrane protein [Agrobacterium larrymoorei]
MLMLIPKLAIESAAVAFFLTYLFLLALRLPYLTAAHLKAHADRDDLPAIAIIFITLFAVVVAVVSLFMALNHSGETALSLTLSFLSVILGWLTIHTMAAVHYAHLFWRPSADRGKREPKGGMDFPDTASPGIYEFLYFSVVIGMTAQTSDVAVTTTAMRKVTLVHSIVSFFFNTVLVAAAVNAAVSLAG